MASFLSLYKAVTYHINENTGCNETAIHTTVQVVTYGKTPSPGLETDDLTPGSDFLPHAYD